MRIISGELGGRVLAAPPGDRTRPTSDKVRAAIFNILGPVPEDARVLDLFAGAGALGLEALSRGAAHATLVDRDAAAIKAIHANVAALGVADRAQVVRSDAHAFLGRSSGAFPGSFTWIFVDPPYAGEDARRVLGGLGALLAPGGRVIVEHDRRNAPGERHGVLLCQDVRKYGDTCVAFYERAE
jgi:16S rRNA (guanine966-N2)-methyltransferase